MLLNDRSVNDQTRWDKLLLIDDFNNPYPHGHHVSQTVSSESLSVIRVRGGMRWGWFAGFNTAEDILFGNKPLPLDFRKYQIIGYILSMMLKLFWVLGNFSLSLMQDKKDFNKYSNHTQNSKNLIYKIPSYTGEI